MRQPTLGDDFDFINLSQDVIYFYKSNVLKKESRNILLDTIRIPKNLNNLKSKLPKSKYAGSYDSN